MRWLIMLIMVLGTGLSCSNRLRAAGHVEHRPSICNGGYLVKIHVRPHFYWMWYLEDTVSVGDSVEIWDNDTKIYNK